MRDEEESFLGSLKLNYHGLRVLNTVLDRLIKDKELAKKIYADDADDIKVINGIAGQIRAQWEQAKAHEKLWGNQPKG